jgi:intracellular septation protein A
MALQLWTSVVVLIFGCVDLCSGKQTVIIKIKIDLLLFTFLAKVTVGISTQSSLFR